MVARHDRGTRKQNLKGDEGLDAEPDGVDEVDDVRGDSIRSGRRRRWRKGKKERNTY
jgi:hypothetical protein